MQQKYLTDSPDTINSNFFDISLSHHAWSRPYLHLCEAFLHSFLHPMLYLRQKAPNKMHDQKTLGETSMD